MEQKTFTTSMKLLKHLLVGQLENTDFLNGTLDKIKIAAANMGYTAMRVAVLSRKCSANKPALRVAPER